MKTVILKSTSNCVLNTKIQEQLENQEWNNLIIEFHYQTCKDISNNIEYSVLIIGR